MSMLGYEFQVLSGLDLKNLAKNITVEIHVENKRNFSTTVFTFDKKQL